MENNWKSEEITRLFGANDHLIWIIRENEEDIETPEGYYEKKTDNVTIRRKVYVRRFFCNEVPVIAKLYKNSKNGEICYYFPGVPIKENVKRFTR